MNWHLNKPLLLLAPCLLFSGLQANAQCYAHADPVEDSLSASHVLRIKITAIETITSATGNISTEYTFQTVKAFQGEADGGVIVMDGGDNGVLTKMVSNFKKLEKRQYYVYLKELSEGRYELIKTHANKVINGAKQDGLVDKILNRAKCKDHNHCQHDHSGSEEEIALSLEQETEQSQKSDLGAVVPSGVTQSKVSDSGFLETRTGIPTRFVASDGDRALTYSIDAEYTPSGFSRQEAIDAVHDVVTIWASETNLKFQYLGEEELGKSSLTLGSAEGANGHIYIQLHDEYSALGSSTLGRGGAYMASYEGNGSGGTINGLEFDKRTFGYLSMNTDASTNQTLNGFKSVLSHELGHCLGLHHSSEDSKEKDSQLKGALMYYAVNSSTASPNLRDYDRGYINLAYPQGESIPYIGYTYGNVITTSTKSPVGNTFPLVISGADDGGESLITVSSSSGASATVDTVARTITLVPTGYWSTNVLADEDVQSGSAWGRYRYKISNGTHVSGVGGFIVTGYYEDATAGDGISSDWASSYGISEFPDADPDGDGFTNRQEFNRGTDPSVANPPIQATLDVDGEFAQFTPVGLAETLILEASNDLTNWDSLYSIGTPDTVITTLPVNNYKFFRVRSN
ncbi:Matrixin [Rubritalea squalenifaciens DSM 18772]|uniref:Matrixin n=1 Tax=Rubritalea squalenifaciens DSM 18772 TaxID=1123071 RepID=A0A1M6EAJ2_9BACT|nr:matrixin family metalloprotease [Rubritalea squalenifaciens]SHI82471.1 Matrixin [Rubritalea squalenifaciens DSM 18772]